MMMKQNDKPYNKLSRMPSAYVIAKYIRLSIDDGITESLSIPNQRLILDRHIDGLDVPNAEVLEFVEIITTSLIQLHVKGAKFKSPEKPLIQGFSR